MIDYERSFKKLVQQIEMERGFAINENFNRESEFLKGAIFAYDSIFRLAKKLENGEFFIEEDEIEMDEDEEEL